MTEPEALQAALDSYFSARPGWPRFNYEACFRAGWNTYLSGTDDQSGGYLANTTERAVYTAGRFAAAGWIKP